MQEKQSLIINDLQNQSRAISADSVDLEITKSEINIKFSLPDSAGVQYPTELTIKGKKSL